MKCLKTTILLFCLLAGTCFAGTGPQAYAEKITKKKTAEPTPFTKTETPSEAESVPETDDKVNLLFENAAANANTDETLSEKNKAEIPLSEEAARDARYQRAYPFLAGLEVINVLLLAAGVLLDRVPGLARRIAGKKKPQMKKAFKEGGSILFVPEGNMGSANKGGINPDLAERIRQLEEWKKSGMISKEEYRKLKERYSDARRREGEEI